MRLVALTPLIRDAVGAKWKPTTDRLEELLVVHKLEPDEAVLRKLVVDEDAEEVRFKRMQIPVVRYKRDRAALNWRLRAQFEEIVARQLARSRNAFAPAFSCVNASTPIPAASAPLAKGRRREVGRRELDHWDSTMGLFEMRGAAGWDYCDVVRLSDAPMPGGEYRRR